MNLGTLSTSSIQDRFTYGEHLRPIRDWMILLAIAGVCFLLSAAWNGWLFIRALEGEAVGSETMLPEVRIDEITAAQDAFIIRAEERQKYEGEYHFVDPS